ncbi:MAG: DUF4249 domain-containing protein [Bacteroidetes bacterium]|jgi:hypothetical protein|nr:DUF4249 domain-containing protein [Bacteroidota bacterium]
MKNLTKAVFGIFLVLGLFSACTETIDIELDDSFTRLVVDGQISTDTMAHLVRLSQSANYFSNTEPAAVSGASVVVDDGSQAITLFEYPEGSGMYYTPSNYYGIPGNDYLLRVSLPEAIGESKNYEATNTMPQTAFQLDSIQLEFRNPPGFWMVKLFARDPPTTDFYRLDVLRNGLILTDTAYRTAILDDRLINGNNTNGITVMFLYEDEVMPGDTISLIMSAISKDYYEFLLELRNESGFSNPLFGGPPANISSNLREGGLGYFATLKTSSVSLVADSSLWQR